MIQIVAKNYIAEDNIEGFKTLAKKLVEETNLKDEGCIRYELFQDINDPSVFAFIEEWQDQNALDKHMASKHFTEIVPQLSAFGKKEGEANLYQKVK